MLAVLEGCIEGYESLHTQTDMLQSDISISNLMMNKDDNNPSRQAFIIDLDLAIKEQRKGSSGEWGKTDPWFPAYHSSSPPVLPIAGDTVAMYLSSQ
jgi:hypothetical protein